MSSSEIRKSIEIITESPKVTAPVNRKGETIENNVLVNIQTLTKEVKAKGRYNFNKGFLSFQDIMDDPTQYVQKYRKESQADTSNLVTYLSSMKKDSRYTDKQHYLRQGWEARGYTNGQIILIWFKEKQENLMIFARHNQAIGELRDFFKFFGIIS